MNKITDEQYHAMKDHVSASGLKQFMISPAHYHHWLQAEQKGTEDLKIGKATHTCILEPENIDKLYGLKMHNWSTKEGKLERARFESEGKIAMDRDFFDMVGGIAQSIKKHPTALEIYGISAIKEHPIFWTDEDTGLPCRCKPDVLIPFALCLDLKTTADASMAAFQRDMIKYGYLIQRAHYMHGINSIGYCGLSWKFLVVEKTPPYAVTVYEPDQEAIEWGIRQRTNLMRDLAYCVEKNAWPSYQDDSEKISIPKWVKNYE